MLKVFVTSLDDVEEAYRGLYVATEGGFILQTDQKDKLDEFRTNNRTLHKKVGDLETAAQAFAGIDVEKYKKGLDAITQQDKIKEADLIEKGEVDKLVEMRTTKMRTEYDEQLAAKGTAYDQMTGENKALREQLSVLKIDTTVQNQINKVSKVKKGALPDVLARARGTFTIDEKGQIVPKTPGGEQVFGADGNPLTIEGFAQDLVTNASHLFEPSSGGGAGGGKDDNNRDENIKTIAAGDSQAFGSNLEDIATGKVKVATPSEG